MSYISRKPIEDLKTFLKECALNAVLLHHIAKNCRIKIQCSECKSERHNAAFHPGPAPWTKEADPAPEHGGEEEEVLP